MNLATCAKCETLYNAPDVEPASASRVCPRCLGVAELLLAADALNTAVKRELERAHTTRRMAMFTEAELAPLSARAAAAIEKARAL